MRDLLHDSVEDQLPAEPITKPVTQRPKSARQPYTQGRRTPERRGKQSTKSRPHSASPARVTSSSPGRTYNAYADYIEAMEDREYYTQRPFTATGGATGGARGVPGGGRQSRVDTAPRPRSRPAPSDFSPMPAVRKTLEFSGETQVHIIDDDDYDVTPRLPEPRLQEREVKPVKAYVPKPFNEIVKVQRPESTRKDRDRR